MPAKSDKGVHALWRHLSTHSTHGVNYYPHTADKSLLDPSMALERHAAHVRDCAACRGALKNVKVRGLNMPPQMTKRLGDDTTGCQGHGGGVLMLDVLFLWCCCSHVIQVSVVVSGSLVECHH